MTWYKVDFSHDQLAGGASDNIMGEFSQLLMIHGAPLDMALFAQVTDEGSTYFFSPDSIHYASNLIERLGCVPCERPSRGDDWRMSLICGNQDAFRLLG